MNSKPHIIGKQVFEAEFNSSENGFAFRTEFTDLAKQNLLEVIEEVLDELSPKNSLLRLDKIEIDLGKVSYPFDVLSLKESLRTKLRNELNFKVVSIRHKSPDSSEGKETLLSIQKTEEEIILFFLQEGYLPWWIAERGTFSVTQIINNRFDKNPQSLLVIFEKIKSNANQINRFIFHSDKKVLFFVVCHYAAIPVSSVESMEQKIYEEGFERFIKNLSLVFRAFLASYFILEKKKFVSQEDLIVEFSEYALETDRLATYQLMEIFPERYMISWLKNYFPAYVLLFQRFVSAISNENSIKDKRKAYQTFYKSFLKTISSTAQLSIEQSTTVLIKELTTLSDSLGIQLRKLTAELATKQTEEDPVNLLLKDSQIENTLLQYFQFGILSWRDRIAGIAGIEKIILELHYKNPQNLRTIFSKLPLSVYPSLLGRLENNLDKKVAGIIFNNYFSKTAAKEQLESVQYRENILRLFFEKGTVPWIEIINNNIPQVEAMIVSFYHKDPGILVE